jgi:hypothetical protein
MPTKFKILAIAAALAAGTSSAALAEYPCAPGYALYGGVCQPMPAPGYRPAPGYPSGPVAGAATGAERGAVRGNAAAGPVGAIVGGAIGTATGTIAGTANALSGGSTPPAPTCAPGYYYSDGYCYPYSRR